MKTTLRVAALCTVLGLALAAPAADMTKYRAKPGNKMRIEGTSTIHAWNAESTFVGGRLELDPAFPADPANKDLKPGKLNANANVSILIRTFKCSSGAAMDTIMQETMDAKTYPKIEYKLKELTFKEFKDDAMVCDATGDLTLHGQTKPISMPVMIRRPDAKTVKVSGTVDTKMTDFGLTPPAPKVALGLIKTGDEVKLIFDWTVEKVAEGAAAAAPAAEAAPAAK